MPKQPKKHSQKKLRHAPLGEQIAVSEEKGYLKAPRPQRKPLDKTSAASKGIRNNATILKEDDDTEMMIEDNGDDDNADNNDDDDDEYDQNSSSSSTSKSRQVFPSLSAIYNAADIKGGKKNKKQVMKLGDGNDDSDVDDDDDMNGLVDAEEEEYEDVELTAEDEAALSLFMSNKPAQQQNLADMIMAKINEKEANGGGNNGGNDGGGGGGGGVDAQIRDRLDEKVIAVYTQVGKYLSQYTTGKIPKAFKIIPTLRNWEEILYLTSPESWTANAVLVATKLFSSNLNVKMAQRYYYLILLPRCRDNIEKYKKLNFHLYESLRRAIFKPEAFFKGLILPLAEDGDSVSLKESVIFSSILAKCSIPVIQSSVCLIKLTELPFTACQTIFMKALLNKKYSFPNKCIDLLVKYFHNFTVEKRTLPVLWHQTLYVFVQRYRSSFTPAQKESLKAVLRVHQHKVLTDIIRHELFSTQVPV